MHVHLKLISSNYNSNKTLNQFFRHSFATVGAVHVNKINYKFSNITTETQLSH